MFSIQKSPARQAFDASAKTPKDLATYWSAEPLNATAMVTLEIDISLAPEEPAVQTLQAFKEEVLGTTRGREEREQRFAAFVEAHPEAIEFFAHHFQAEDALNAATTQTKRSSTIGWEADHVGPGTHVYVSMVVDKVPVGQQITGVKIGTIG